MNGYAVQLIYVYFSANIYNNFATIATTFNLNLISNLAQFFI